MKEDHVLELLKQEHLDMLIRLAFELEAARIVEQLEEESERAFTHQEEQSAQLALDSAYDRLRQKEESERKNRRADRHHRRIMRAVEILACVILAVGISAPVAVANIHTLRQKIMEFLIRIDDQNESASIQYFGEMEVPVDWKGEYFPAYLPEGTEIVEVDPIVRTMITLSLNGNASISFRENDEDYHVVMGMENEETSTIDIRGSEATMWEYDDDEYYIRMIWNNGTRWFMLETRNIEKNVAYMIAESVKKISD